MTDNMYEIPDDIRKAEQKLQVIKAGKDLARAVLFRIERSEPVGVMSEDDIFMLASAATREDPVGRILELENSIRDLHHQLNVKTDQLIQANAQLNQTKQEGNVLISRAVNESRSVKNELEQTRTDLAECQLDNAALIRVLKILSHG